MMVRAVIFDLYGVLAINGWQAFKAAHFAEDEDVWGRLFQLGRRVDVGLSDYAELVQFTAEVSGETEETVRYQLEHTVVNTGLLEFIHTELEGIYRLGVLSNASNDEVIGRIFSQEQQRLFDTITLSHHVGMVKPDIHMYQVVADKLGVEPESCVFVDDQERHAAGARDAGMYALLYRDLEEFKRDIEKLLANS